MKQLHVTWFDLDQLPLIQLWAAARAAGYELVWSVARGRVVMRRMPG